MKENTQNGTYITIRIHEHIKKVHNIQNETEAYKTHNHTYTIDLNGSITMCL